MKSLFDSEVYTHTRHRINQLSENSQKRWGKMSVGQMLHHCQGTLNIMLKGDYGLKPSLLGQLFFKRMLYSDIPYPKNLRTSRFLKEKEPRDFIIEKKNILAVLDEFECQRNRVEWKYHPAYGYFTKQQWGQLQYKHLDHHLRQFGV